MKNIDYLYNNSISPINDDNLFHLIKLYSISNSIEEYKYNVMNYTNKSNKKNINYKNELFNYLKNIINTDNLQKNNNVISIKSDDNNNSNFSLVLNTNYNSTMKFSKLFIKECINNDLDFNIDINLKGETDHPLIIFCNDKNVKKYLNIIDKLKNNYPNLFKDINKPGLLFSKINNKVGICSNEFGIDNFYDRRCMELFDVIDFCYMSYIYKNFNTFFFHNEIGIPIIDYLTNIVTTNVFDKLRNSELEDYDFYLHYGITKEEINSNQYYNFVENGIRHLLIKRFINEEKNTDIELNYHINNKSKGQIVVDNEELNELLRYASYNIIINRKDLFNNIVNGIDDLCYFSGIDKNNYSFDYESIKRKENSNIKKKML